MERKEVKKILEDAGVSPRLLQMPAVMERMYWYLCNEKESYIRKILDVGENGEIILKDKSGDKQIMKFEEMGKGAFYSNKASNYFGDLGSNCELAGQYLIDEYGMDIGYRPSGYDLGYTSIDYEKSDFITDDMDFSKINMKLFDISRSPDGYIMFRGEKTEEKDQGDAILNCNNYNSRNDRRVHTIGWEGNKAFLTTNYPITQKWFEAREQNKKQETTNNSQKTVTETEIDASQESIIETEKNETIQSLEKRVEFFKTERDNTIEQNKQLRQENRDLNDKVHRLQNMLKRTLETCSDIKRSPFGKLFFGKKLKELPQPEDKSMDDSRE